MTHVTAELAKRASHLTLDGISADALIVAKQCLLDWLGVSIAARHDPLVEILAATVEEDGGSQDCSLIGRRCRTSASHAALVNGAMGHALDYDDVIIPMGHPTVPVAPVCLALGERARISGADFLTAFVAGVETEVRVAHFVGPTHYSRGFHGTATFGGFGAAAAAGRLLELDATQMAAAFGIAGTQAAGLKAMFGTMCKPLHAGKAAANGILAARLASRGFTSHPAVLEADQGFADTQADGGDADAGLQSPPGGFWIRNTLFKYHAACYLTHSTLNAAAELRQRAGFSAAAVERIEIGIDPGHLRVCAIPEPKTALEAKFSLAMTTAMVLAGENTADEAIFSDETIHRPDLVALARKVVLNPRATASVTLSDVMVRLEGGEVLEASHDVAHPEKDLDLQWRRLEQKFHALAGTGVGGTVNEVISLVRDLEHQSSLKALIDLVA